MLHLDHTVNESVILWSCYCFLVTAEYTDVGVNRFPSYSYAFVAVTIETCVVFSGDQVKVAKFVNFKQTFL